MPPVPGRYRVTIGPQSNMLRPRFLLGELIPPSILGQLLQHITFVDQILITPVMAL